MISYPIDPTKASELRALQAQIVSQPIPRNFLPLRNACRALTGDARVGHWQVGTDRLHLDLEDAR